MKGQNSKEICEKNELGVLPITNCGFPVPGNEENGKDTVKSIDSSFYLGEEMDLAVLLIDLFIFGMIIAGWLLIRYLRKGKTFEPDEKRLQARREAEAIQFIKT
ncbi:MAG: hypothetical protein ACE5OZ_04400 [Candidatus Heimdallarchaeota archaeon]